MDVAKEDWLKEYLDGIQRSIDLGFERVDARAKIEAKADSKRDRRLDDLEKWKTKAVVIVVVVGGGISVAGRLVWDIIKISI